MAWKVFSAFVIVLCGTTFLGILSVLVVGTSGYHVYLEDGDHLEVIEAPGEKVEVTLVGYSLAGKWALRDGLHLALDGTTVQFAAPKPRDWGSSITFSTRNSHDFEIAGVFEVPRNGLVPRELHGNITGAILRPVVVGEDEFADRQMDLDVPVTVHVVTPDEASRAHRARLVAEGGVFLAAAPFLAVFGALWLAADNRSLL